jgi:hypothetical protein
MLVNKDCIRNKNLDAVSACNRTYYGDVGKTYELELHRPREDRMPFVCHLTFQAGGGDLGDLVQVLPTLIHAINLRISALQLLLSH